MSRSDAVQAGSGKISHDIHPRNLERESAMKSFLLIACTAGLLASAALRGRSRKRAPGRA
jgi:hypothetical protein